MRWPKPQWCWLHGHEPSEKQEHVVRFCIHCETIAPMRLQPESIQAISAGIDEVGEAIAYIMQQLATVMGQATISMASFILHLATLKGTIAEATNWRARH